MNSFFRVIIWLFAAIFFQKDLRFNPARCRVLVEFVSIEIIQNSGLQKFRANAWPSLFSTFSVPELQAIQMVC